MERSLDFQEVDFGISCNDLESLRQAYEATMTACEGGGEGTYG